MSLLSLLPVSALKSQFVFQDLPLPDLVLIWYRLAPNIKDTLPKNLTLAFLYMLHVEKYTNEKPKDEHGKIGIQKKRWRSLKRFGEWVSCACDSNCGQNWNFANDLGLWQTDQECRLLQLFNSSNSNDLRSSPKYRRTLDRWKELSTDS